MLPLIDRVREHAVDPERGEPERERGEESHQQHQRPRTIGRVGDHAVERARGRQRQIRIEALHRRANRRDERRLIGRTLHGEIESAERELAIREVNRRLGRLRERRVLHVRDDADDAVLRVRRHEHGAHRSDVAHARRDALADRILVRPFATRERIVDDDDAFAVDRVVRIEEPPLEQRHAEDGEVPLVDALMLRERHIGVRRPRPPFDQESQTPRRIERQEIREPGVGDAQLRAQ